MPKHQAARGRHRKLSPGSLGGKMVLLLTGVGLAGALALTALLFLIITPSFSQLEQNAVAGHVARTRAALGEFAAKVESTARDYGDWTDSYDYIANPTKAFEEESFATTAMVNLDVNGMAYIGNDGRVVIARWLDLNTEADIAPMRERLTGAIAKIDLGKTLRKGDSASNFYLRLGNELAAVAVAQVRRSDGSGDPRGYVVMARTISSEQLSKLLQLKARIALDGHAPDAVITPHDSTIDIAVPIAGPDGGTVAAAAYTVPRDLSLLGTRMLALAVVGSVVLLAIVLWVLRLAISRLVIRPLHRVEKHMGVVRESGGLGLLTEKPRADEIGSLVTSFNSMLEQLKDLREQLEVQSFTLGRSESAVAVMHNVRNALNPISTVLSQGASAAPAVDKSILDRALSELTRDDIPEARRQKLVAFVAAASQAIEEEREERRQQIEIGREALHNVLEIIGKQQEAAHERPQLEMCDLTDIVAKNATIARYSGSCSISVSFPSRPHWVMANRIILSQVVGNLFSNAAEAVAATGRGTGSITVAVHEKDGRAELVIRDDGEGFDPEIGATLFQRGFSTREHKSGGLGLHWCANSMIAMEGKLDLLSEGKGTGARAVLTLKAAEVPAGAEGLAA